MTDVTYLKYARKGIPKMNKLTVQKILLSIIVVIALIGLAKTFISPQEDLGEVISQQIRIRIGEGP